MTDDLAFPKIPKREYPDLVERKPLSKFDYATLFLAQKGKCAVCGCRLEKGRVRDEHIVALKVGGDNSLSNRALWCLDCTKPKDALDKGRIAKGKRIRGETCVGPKRKIQNRTSFPKGRPLQSGGFRGSRKFDGTVSWRER